jgi:hypothetical protein
MLVSKVYPVTADQGAMALSIVQFTDARALNNVATEWIEASPEFDAPSIRSKSDDGGTVRSD